MTKIDAIVNWTTNKIYAMRKHSSLGDTKCVLDNLQETKHMVLFVFAR